MPRRTDSAPIRRASDACDCLRKVRRLPATTLYRPKPAVFRAQKGHAAMHLWRRGNLSARGAANDPCRTKPDARSRFTLWWGRSPHRETHDHRGARRVSSRDFRSDTVATGEPYRRPQGYCGAIRRQRAVHPAQLGLCAGWWRASVRADRVRNGEEGERQREQERPPHI